MTYTKEIVIQHQNYFIQIIQEYSLKFITKYFTMKKQRLLSTNKNKSAYASPIIPSSPYSNTKSRKNSAKKIPQITDWTQVLAQISKVTNKVKKLCKQNTQTSQFIRSKPQNKIQLASYCSCEPSFKSAMTTPLKQKSQHNTPNCHSITNSSINTKINSSFCSSKCHQLMYECMKINSQNKKLIEEKQQLQKRLYFQSKQKRQLRWKLQKQKQRRIQQYPISRTMNNSFTLRLSSHSNAGDNKLSQMSYLTSKRFSPLKSGNSKKSKPKNMKIRQDSSKTDSLLIDVSMNGEPTSTNQDRDKTQNQYMASSKTMKSINLEKDLHQLLEICKYETDHRKKKLLRKQMKMIAEQMKSLRLQ